MSEFSNRKSVGLDVYIAKFDGTEEIEHLLGYKSENTRRVSSTENIIRHGNIYSSKDLIKFLKDGKLPGEFIG